MTSVLVRIVRSSHGESGVDAMLAAAGSGHDAAFLDCTDNWVSLSEVLALLQAGIDVTGDAMLARRVGEQAVRQHAGTQVATLLRSLGSPEAILGGITVTAAKFSAVSDMEAIEAGPGGAVVRAVARPGFRRERLLCDWTAGLLSQPCALFGLPPARVEETHCQARGDAECRFVVSWDKELAEAAADPEHRLTALEGQVVAMSERLENAYATASDLVSPDDLDTVLARIVERAANAVRTPSYVLAVQVDPGEAPRVFSDGVAGDVAAEIAKAVTGDGEPPADALCVPVASSRRDYGVLVAMHPAGQRFFPQEARLLALYAKHAAAVLDTTLALRESARRHDHVSALLALSQSLARARTTHEVAAHLTEAVVGIIDCDRSAMWLWDADSERLRIQGVTGIDWDSRPNEIRREATPRLDEMVANPRPLFVEPGGDDAFLDEIMTDGRLVALAVVPIVAREILVGLLTVGVEHHAERLRCSPELVEKLSGVAALAAPALQNGQLIDELGHQVVHDGLTGVLNRTGFGRMIENVLYDELDHERRAGLLYVDLDGFKRLNDEHGHNVGDELLRRVAERLRDTLRDDDTVARLGGDEFAIVLPRVSRRDEVTAAARRVRASFAEPFAVDGIQLKLSASVGEAVSPDDGRTVDALVQHADRGMYAEKADRIR